MAARRVGVAVPLGVLAATDYAAVQGFVLAMALLFVGVKRLIDVIYTLVDPRVGLEG